MPKFNQRIKVLLFLPLLLGSIFLLFKYSKAQFSDSETVLGNSIQVGTWGTTPVATPETTITPTPTEVPPGAPTPTPTETPTPTPTPTPGNLANHIVISEIQTKGNGTNNEFIELYNPTNTLVDISSWSIQYRGGTGNYYRKNFETNNNILPYGYFLIGHNGNSLSVTPDMTWSREYAQAGGTIFLVNNQADLIDTTDSGPSVVDKVAYGTGSDLRPEGSAYSTAPEQNQSIERKAYSASDTTSMMSGLDVTKGNAYDSENNANDFVLRTTSQPQNTSSSPEIP